MTRLLIDLPDDLSGRVQTRAAEAGFASPEEYVRALIIADAAEFDAKAEKILLQRIDAPDAGEMTAGDFEKIRDRVRHESRRRLP
jgi:hypothetical protein